MKVTVSDNGPGITPKDAEIVFDKFRQVGNTMTDKPQGTGLGLAICKRIVEHLGGRIWVESFTRSRRHISPSSFPPNAHHIQSRHRTESVLTSTANADD